MDTEKANNLTLIGDNIKYHETEYRNILSGWFSRTAIVPDVLSTIYNFIVVPPLSHLQSIQGQEDATSYQTLQGESEKENTQNTPPVSRTLTVEIQRAQS